MPVPNLPGSGREPCNPLPEPWPLSPTPGLVLNPAGVSERYAGQLAGPNVVFRVESPYYNYYSRFFKPYKHFIPVKYDLSDLVAKVRS